VRVCIVQPGFGPTSESFIRAHAEYLPADVTVVHGVPPILENRPVLGRSLASRALRKALMLIAGRRWEGELTRAYLKAFRETRPDVVLAEYGPMGVGVMDALSRLGIPLVVHFHGYDASMRSVLKEHAASYPVLFERATAIIAVSRAMERKLISLGAPAEKVHCNPYGVDCRVFGGARPRESDAVFLAVGRFVEKKAPHLTISAFSKVLASCAGARLRMIGDGPLLKSSQALAIQLGIQHAVTFLGARYNAFVQDEMRRARAFVQHSMQAPSGDCEGTPVAILEAGATGLAVVSTRHAGIPDVVIEHETGFLVDEGDVDGMASCMRLLATDAELAQTMGDAARQRVERQFAVEQSIARLWAIIMRGAGGTAASVHEPAGSASAGAAW
jgi:colanic acid/amylovoran biosynthesis glycosyltransferase